MSETRAIAGPPSGQRVLLAGLGARRTAELSAALRLAGVRCEPVAPLDLVEAAAESPPRMVLVGDGEAALNACAHLKEDQRTRMVKVAMLSPRGDLVRRLMALTAGADEVVPVAGRARLAERVVALAVPHRRPVPAAGNARPTRRAWAAGEALRMLLSGLGRSADARTRRISRVCDTVAKTLGFGAAARSDLRAAAAMQDLGMIALAESARERHGPLRGSEWETVRRHPILSEQLARVLGASRECARIVRAHHERPDGRGYPDGLRKARIPEGARVLAAAAAFDAAAAGRPYRPPLGVAAALEEMERAARDGQLDAEVVAALREAGRRGALRMPAAPAVLELPRALVFGVGDPASRARMAAQAAGFDPVHALSASTARTALANGGYGLVVACAGRDPEPAIALLAQAREREGTAETILVCAGLPFSRMRELVRAGATDALDVQVGPAEMEAVFRGVRSRLQWTPAEPRAAAARKGPRLPPFLGRIAADMAAELSALAAASELACDAATRLPPGVAGPGAAAAVEDAIAASAASAEIARRLLDRAGDLKTLAGTEAREGVDLAESVASARRLTAPWLERVALELSVAAVPPAEGNARDALEVVIELLGWAARASGARGRVGVSTGFDGRAAWVRIEDDGPTLSEEIRRGFEQENGAGQGHGPLGRAAAAARRMRGALEVRAREPRGNAVTLRLPARPLA